MELKYNDEHFVLCDCGYCEHQMLFGLLDIDDEHEFISVQFHLANYKNIFQRIWYAIRYIFGYKSRYGAFDEILLSKKMAEDLGLFLMDFIWIGADRETATTTSSSANNYQVSVKG